MTHTGAAPQPEWRVIPRPKRIEAEGKPLALKDGMAWSITQPAGETRIERALRGSLTGLGLKNTRGKIVQGKGAETTIRIGETNAQEAAPGEWARHPEGYFLQAAAGGILIAASTPQGAFYGLQTLSQLLRRDTHGCECPAVQVADWPSMSFRGAHWFPSASGVSFHRKLIERVMARYKMNRAVIQCEAARWDSHPEIAGPNSISKKDLAGLVALCRRDFIEPIPLVNVPGHAQWMFRNHQHLDLAEDPSAAYAYCVSNPESDRFIKQILTEAEEVFKPHAFHLGHDEVTIRGQFPHPGCPRCRGKSVTELVLENAARLGAWLKSKHQRMLVWGDMFLAPQEVPDAATAPNPQEAHARRVGLPAGTVVADWHYGTGSQYPSLDLFHRDGLQTIACTWYEPENIYRFSQAARKAGSLGLLQTTWCGYFQDEKVLRSEARQFSAFILAAEYAWSGRVDPPSALPYDPGLEFARAFNADPTAR